MGLFDILEAKRRTESKPKKVHPSAQEEFGQYELAVLSGVNYNRGRRYDIFYKGGKGPGSAEYLEKHGTEGPMSPDDRQALDAYNNRDRSVRGDNPDWGTGPDQRPIPQAPPKYLLGKPDVDRDYLEGLLDEYDRWQKTGSRFVAFETDKTRRKQFNLKRFTGNSQGFSGAMMGKATTQRKTLLG